MRWAIVLLLSSCVTSPDSEDVRRAAERADTLERERLVRAAAREALARYGCDERADLERVSEERFVVRSGCELLDGVHVRCAFKGAWTSDNACEGLPIPKKIRAHEVEDPSDG